MKEKAIIIGSGIGGLAAAIRLSLKGYETHLYEKNSENGGKIGELRLDGCRFDTGPSLFTLPLLVDELFTLAGENPREHFNYVPLASSCRYFWDDGASSMHGLTGTGLPKRRRGSRESLVRRFWASLMNVLNSMTSPLESLSSRRSISLIISVNRSRSTLPATSGN